ncbi:hypothetical protein ACUN9Z_27510, partial [Escherichia sp. HC-CC4]
MVETQVKFIVVGHHKRIEQASALAAAIGPTCTMLIDEQYSGANAGHRRALEWASWQDCRVVILEDDALPVAGFTQLVGEWLYRFPDSLVSFYLGTGRPPQYQMQVAERLIVADKTRSDFITLPRLIHGVCYSVPPHRISRVLSRWDSNKPADFAVGDAGGGSVVYPCYSLVDHADGEPI